MKERVESGSTGSSGRQLAKLEPVATPPPNNMRHQHRIQLKNSNCDGPEDDPAQRQCLSPLLSPTLSESSSVSSSSPVPSSKRYLRKEKIGQGAQGSVYRCIEVATGKELAVKVIMTHELSPAELEAIKREVKTIKKLHHRHLVQYYKATEKKSKQLSIYMEFVAGGSLSAMLRHDGALPQPTVKKFTRQLCEALQHLHQNRIAHRDIKCANVFLSSSREDIKLGDFGAFKEVGSVSLVGGLKGTPHWMAPEVIRAEQHTSEDGWFKADIWSLGCAVIEMLTGHSPWQQYSNPLTAMYQIVSSNNTPTIPADATEETASFLKLCLQRNPDERASIGTLLQHPFVQTVEITESHTATTSPQQQQAVQSDAKPIRRLAKLKSPRTSGPEDSSDERRGPEQHVSSPMRLRNATAAAAEAVIETAPATPDKPASKPHVAESIAASHIPPSQPRSSLRKPSIVPRLKPLDLIPIPSPSNQERESRSNQEHSAASTPVKPLKATPPSISRGASAAALGAPLPRIDSKHGGNGIPITPVRLRRLSTAPAATRDPEDIMNSTPAVHKLKLPPLTARPASSASGSSSFN